jgi:hypothetical protein
MLKRLALLAACAFTAALPAGAQYTGFVDAANELAGASIALPIGGPSNHAYAQTFTAETTSFTVGLMLPVTCGSAPLYISMYDTTAEGLPGVNAQLGGAYVDASTLRAGGRFTLVGFSGGTLLQAGQRYTIVIASSGGDCQIRRSSAATSYAGGKGFRYSTAFPGWIPFSDDGSPDDLPFRVITVN